MTPGLPDVVGQLLEFEVPYFRQGGPQGFQQRLRKERFLDLDDDGRLWTLAGLIPRIVPFLHQEGYQVTVTDRTSWPQFEYADVSLLEVPGLESDDKAFLDAIHQNPRGQLHVRRQDDLARRIALLGDFHPKANVAVVTANRDQAKGLFGRLKQHTNRPMTLSPQIDRQQCQMIICTAATFATFGQRDWDVLVFINVEAALGKRVQETLVETNEQLRYVFPANNRRLGPRTELVLEALFGPVIYQQPSPYGIPADVNVVLAACPGITTSTKYPVLHRKRVWVWRNAERNGAVAELAGAFEHGDVATLAGYGVPSAAITVPGAEAQRQATVAVLLESTEHAKELLPLLPGWRLLHAAPHGDGGERDVADSASAVTHRAITTMVYAEKHGILSDIVIRADGTDDWPLSADRFPRRACSNADSVLLIDFADRMDGNLTTSVRRRIRAYQRLGWQIMPPGGHRPCGQEDQLRTTPTDHEPEA